jgi:hypothetical protein
MAGKGIEVIVLDGANRFNSYTVSSFARRTLISPEKLLKSIRIARAFTCYQMATLMGERLVSLVHARTVGAIHESPLQRPWVILLGPLTTFLDEDVPEREVRPLFERSLKKIEEMASKGVPFLSFQSSVFPDLKRAYLMRRLFQFANEAWRIDLDEEGPKMILEKGVGIVSHCERSEAISRDCGACSERSEESPGLLRQGLATVPKLRDSSQ